MAPDQRSRASGWSTPKPARGSSIRKDWFVSDCRFRDTEADGINLQTGMRSTIVTIARPGEQVMIVLPSGPRVAELLPPASTCSPTARVNCRSWPMAGQSTAAPANRIEDCLFQDITYGCGILISTTFPVGGNIFSGTTVAQRCDVIRCGGFDPGYQWRAAVQLCLDTYTNGISGVNLNNLNISNSVSDGLSVIGGTNTPGDGRADERGRGQREHSQLRHRHWRKERSVGAQ